MLLPGSPATYANRAALRAMGLRWDPERHQWYGTTTAEQVRVLSEQLGLEVRSFGTLEPPSGPSPSRPPALITVSASVSGAVRGPDPSRRLHDGSRTHLESRIAFAGADEDAEEIATPTWRFSLLEITSGLPDDSQEADERAVARSLRDLRARVKTTLAVVAATPGLAETIARDWCKASRFYARFGVSETQLKEGVRDAMDELDSPLQQFEYSTQGPDWRTEEL